MCVSVRANACIFSSLKKEKIEKGEQASEAFRRLINRPVAKLDMCMEGGS